MYNDSVKSNNNNFEKSLGFTPADLLILEIKKPNRPSMQKGESNSRKNTLHHKNSFFSIDDHKYKDPKVRIKIYDKYI